MITLYVLTCLLMGYLGRHRKLGFVGFTIVAILLTPLITGLILLISAPSKASTAAQPPANSTSVSR
jgi:hypothetical protein